MSKWRILSFNCLVFKQIYSIVLIGVLWCSAAKSASICQGYFDVNNSHEFLQSQEFWGRLSDSYKRNFFANFKANIRVYDKLIGKSDHIAFLEKLGFNFQSRATFQIPSIPDLLSKYSGHMHQMVQEGKTPFYFDLVFVFKKPNEESYVFASYGDVIPSGFVPYEGPLESKVFYDLIKEKKFVIGFPSNFYMQETNIYNITSMDHDLAHITSFMQHPEMIPYLHNLAIRKSSIHHEIDENNYMLFLAFEVWNYIPQKEHARWKEFVRGIVPETSDFVSSKKILYNLLKMEKNDFFEFSNRLKFLQHEMVQYSGGALRDIMSQQHLLLKIYRSSFSVKEDNALSEYNILNLLVQYQANRLIFREKMMSIPDLKPDSNNHSLAIDMQLVANIVAIMDGLTKISIEDAYKSFSEEGFVPGSPLETMYKALELKNPRN